MCVKGPNPQRHYLSKPAIYHPELQKTNCPVHAGDVIKLYSPASTLKPLDAESVSRPGDDFCFLFERVGTPLSLRKERHRVLFIYKALLGKLKMI